MNDGYSGLEYFIKPATKYKWKENYYRYIICKLKIFNQTKICCCLSVPFPSSETKIEYYSIILPSSAPGLLKGFSSRFDCWQMFGIQLFWQDLKSSGVLDI